MDKVTIPDQTEKKNDLEIDKLHNFYTYEILDGKINRFTFDRQKIAERLKTLGFFRLDNPDGTCENVRITDNKIQIVSPVQITDALEDFILSLPDREIITHYGKDGEEVKKQTISGYFIQNKLYNKEIQTYINAILDRLRPTEPITLLTDTKTEKYFFFENTAVRCTPDGVFSVPYSQLDGKIWESNILNRNFTYTDRTGDFENFCMDISSGLEERKQSLMSMFGYLMHDFYETDLRAAFFTDVNSENTGNNAGRTGKGLIGKALDQMMNRRRTDRIYTAVPAKNLDFNKDTRFGLANQTTKLLHLEDVNKTFDLETIYNDITDGCTIRSQYGTPTVKMLKLMISINRTIDLKGSSDRGRLIIFELANYYSDQFRPVNKYGRRFFESRWDETQWNAFYSFMLRAETIYLKHGIIEPEEINYSDRRLSESVNEDFRYWFNDYISDYMLDKSRAEFIKNTMYEIFANKYPAYNDRTFRKRFTFWLRRFCELKKIPFCEIRSTNDLFIIFPTDADFSRAREQKV